MKSKRKRIYTRRRSLPSRHAAPSPLRLWMEKCLNVWDAEVLGLWSFSVWDSRLFISDTSRAINTVTVLESSLTQPETQGCSILFSVKKSYTFFFLGPVFSSLIRFQWHYLTHFSAKRRRRCVCVHGACVREWDLCCDDVSATLPLLPHIAARPQGTCWLRHSKLRCVKPFRTSFEFFSPHCHPRANLLHASGTLPSRQASTVLSEGRFAADEGKSHSD